MKTRNNVYLLHYAICNIIYLSSNTILHIVMDIFFEGYLEVNWYCTLVQIENYFLNLCIMFIAMYALDEYIRISCKNNLLTAYFNGYKYFIGSLYIIHVLFLFIVTGVCFGSTKKVKFDVSFIIVTVTYALLLLALIRIAMSLKKELQNIQTQLLRIVLEVSSFVFLFYLPIIVYYNLLNILDANHIEDLDIWQVYSFIFEYMAYSATFVLIYKLFKLNKFFKLAFCKVMCKSRKDLDYSRLDTVPEELSS